MMEKDAKSLLTTPNRPRAIILAPNKELVIQTKDVVKELCHFAKLKSASLTSTTSYINEKRVLEDGVDILIASIDKIEKHIQKKNLYFSQMTHLVCDEIDTFLDAGYTDTISKYIDIGLQHKGNPKMVFLSATYTSKIKSLVDNKFGPKEDNFKVLIDKNTHMNLSNLEHEFLHVDSLDKQMPLLNLIKENQSYIKKTDGATIIFCNSIASCQSLDFFLKENGNTK